MQVEHNKQLAIKDRKIKSLKHELAQAHRRTIDVHNMWMQANEDLAKEYAEELSRKDKKIEPFTKQLLNIQIMLDAENLFLCFALASSDAVVGFTIVTSFLLWGRFLFVYC